MAKRSNATPGGKKNRKYGRKSRKYSHQKYNTKRGYTAGSSHKAGRKRLTIVKVAAVELTEEQKYKLWLSAPYVPDTAFFPFEPKHPDIIPLIVKVGGVPQIEFFCTTHGHARCHKETRMAYMHGAYDVPQSTTSLALQS